MKKFKIRFKRPKIRNFLKFLLTFTFLPLIILKNLWTNKKQKLLRKLLVSLIVVFIMLPIWGAGILGVGAVGGLASGLIPQPREIKGNSMLPTLHDGEFVNFKSNFGLVKLLHGSPKKGDIIVFYTEEKNVEYVKRIIGVPGNTLEIRSGYVFINGEPLQENYINSPRSTFGSKSLKDCEKIEIPERKYFVLGDNRKRSEDSRMIGLISEDTIHAFLPFRNQRKFKDRWHVDTKIEDFEQPTLNQEKYYELLNKKREENGLKALKSNKKLETSTRKRAEMMIKSNDISYEAKKSGYGMERAMRDAGYYNIIRGEVLTVGYYDEEELLNHFLEFSDTKEHLYHREYQETGIAAVIGEIDGCPTQIILQHFGGYVPPNYKKEDIEAWKEILSSLKEVLPSWENIKNYPVTYERNKVKADRLIEIFKIRVSRIEMIVSRMEANQWLTPEERMFIEQDQALYEEELRIAEELNDEIWE